MALSLDTREEDEGLESFREKGPRLYACSRYDYEELGECSHDSYSRVPTVTDYTSTPNLKSLRVNTGAAGLVNKTVDAWTDDLGGCVCVLVVGENCKSMMHLVPNGNDSYENPGAYGFPNYLYGYESPVSATPVIADCLSKMVQRGEDPAKLKAYIIYNRQRSLQPRWQRGVENLQSVMQLQGIPAVKKCPLLMDTTEILHTGDNPDDVLVRGHTTKVTNYGIPGCESWGWGEEEKGRAINLEKWE